MYCTINEVRNKVVQKAITDAGWDESAINQRINEGAAYIESVLIPLGFMREQLIAAPLVKFLNILYARYAILRDIYTNITPSQSGELAFNKWKDNLDKILEMIREGKQCLIREDGALMTPQGADLRTEIIINTPEVKRIFTLEDSVTWEIDSSYFDKSVVGEK